MDSNNHNDYSKTENQIGCGYCQHELTCKDNDHKTNKAKLGCQNFIHWTKEKELRDENI